MTKFNWQTVLKAIREESSKKCWSSKFWNGEDYENKRYKFMLLIVFT